MISVSTNSLIALFSLEMIHAESKDKKKGVSYVAIAVKFIL